MQTDDLENQVSNQTSLLHHLHFPARKSHRQFTMPLSVNGNCGTEIEKTGLLSELPTAKLPTASAFQLPANPVITSPDSSSSNHAVTEKAHQNGHSRQQPMDQITTSPIAPPVFKVLAQTHTNGHPHRMAHSVGQLHNNLDPFPAIEAAAPLSRGVHHNVSWLYDQETRRLSVVRAPTKHRTTAGDVLHFLGYMASATTIVSLYLIVPLMILLNAILPSTWNRLLIALGILAIVEFTICIILAKTTPRSKRKKEDALVQP